MIFQRRPQRRDRARARHPGLLRVVLFLRLRRIVRLPIAQVYRKIRQLEPVCGLIIRPICGLPKPVSPRPVLFPFEPLRLCLPPAPICQLTFFLDDTLALTVAHLSRSCLLGLALRLCASCAAVFGTVSAGPQLVGGG